MTGLLWTVLVSVIVALIAAEVKGGLVGLARSVVRAGARRVPRYADRLTEEWLGEIDAHSERPLSALREAAKLYRDAGRIRLDLAPRRELTRSAQTIKRGVDIGFAALGLLGVMPIMLLIALSIRLVSPGPVFYRQWRRGRRGKQITILRFRTMPLNPHGLDRDRDFGPLGRLLRRTGLSTLPLFWNVLKGDMALVGPRALPEQLADQLDTLAPDRPDLKPGVIGPGYLIELQGGPFTAVLEAERDYVENWSIWRDLRIILWALRPLREPAD